MHFELILYLNGKKCEHHAHAVCVCVCVCVLERCTYVQADYMQFQGMYPRAAGLITSNGPYTKVSNNSILSKRYVVEFWIDHETNILTANIPRRLLLLLHIHTMITGQGYL